jgi:hypothetical protein
MNVGCDLMLHGRYDMGGVLTMKLNALHVGDIGARIWLGVLVCNGKSTTSISVHDNLTFMKHIYVDVNVDVMPMRPRFMQQEWGIWVREERVDQSRSKDVLCIVYFRKNMLGLVQTLIGQ